MDDLYLNRWISPTLSRQVDENPVVVLTGARQVGKSTLLRHLFPEPQWRHLSLDDLEVLGQAQRDPEPLLADPRPLVLDEVQRAPQLLLSVKRIVDRDRKKRRFVLSGSVNLLLMSAVSESLAGRAVFLRLEPFAWGEIQGREPLPCLNDLFEEKFSPDKITVKLSSQARLSHARLYEGWMPVIALEKKNEAALRWMEGYVTSYLERDLRQLSQIDSLADFRRMLSALALRSGGLLNQSEIARDIGMKQPTMHRYINLLETSEWLHRLPAYAVNRGKRLMKTPKAYFFDSGLTAYLAGEHASEESFAAKFTGALLETAVLQHLRIWGGMQAPQARCHYWRTLDGSEVDFVVEWGKKILACEVKAKSKVSFSDAENLRQFLKTYPRCAGGVVIYTGQEVLQLDHSIWALPFELLI